MKITRIDHIAVCVPNMDAAIPAWIETLGLLLGTREYVPAQKTEAAFVLTPDEAGACVELIAPPSPAHATSAEPDPKNPGLDKFLSNQKGRAGLHHVAFGVVDIAAALRELDEKGVPLIDKVPRPGARGHQVGFLHPSAMGGILVELVSDSH